MPPALPQTEEDDVPSRARRVTLPGLLLHLKPGVEMELELLELRAGSEVLKGLSLLRYGQGRCASAFALAYNQ